MQTICNLRTLAVNKSHYFANPSISNVSYAIMIYFWLFRNYKKVSTSNLLFEVTPWHICQISVVNYQSCVSALKDKCCRSVSSIIADIAEGWYFESLLKAISMTTFQFHSLCGLIVLYKALCHVSFPECFNAFCCQKRTSHEHSCTEVKFYGRGLYKIYQFCLQFNAQSKGCGHIATLFCIFYFFTLNIRMK